LVLPGLQWLFFRQTRTAQATSQLSTMRFAAPLRTVSHAKVAASSAIDVDAGRTWKSLSSVAAAATQVVTSADETRLAGRLRLGEDWRRVPQGIVAAHGTFVSEGRFLANASQARAVAELARVPDSIAEAREARDNWDADQAKLTACAVAAAERVGKEREAAACYWSDSRVKSLLQRVPTTPLEPGVIGPVCWLTLGPPPVLRLAGCYLHGPVGSGKSTIMDLFCLFGSGGLRVRRQHFHEFFLWLHQSMLEFRGPRPEAPHSHILARVADHVKKEGIDVLCLDEFAVTNVADAAILAELLKLLAERYIALVCTTNRPPEDLYQDGLHRERYLPAIVNRLRGNFIVAMVDGLDYREELFCAELAARAGTMPPVADSGTSSGTGIVPHVFFHGEDIDTVIRNALAGDVGGMPKFVAGTVKVAWGRCIEVPGIASGFARFGFDDLCRRALSAEDFLHLALQFHTVVVHNIPRLSLEEHNEARRFTNLVDAFYEHNTRLICHFEVPLGDVLASVEALQGATVDNQNAESLGVFEKMYDDSPNFQLQIKELGGRDKYKELRDRREAEEMRATAHRIGRLANPEAAGGGASGSGWSSAPAAADLSAPQEGVAGVMVAAVGSLQESGFAARRALSRLKEMQTTPYIEAAQRRREAMAS